MPSLYRAIHSFTAYPAFYTSRCAGSWRECHQWTRHSQVLNSWKSGECTMGRPVLQAMAHPEYMVASITRKLYRFDSIR
jgi:hypothetical protein